METKTIQTKKDLLMALLKINDCADKVTIEKGEIVTKLKVAHVSREVFKAINNSIECLCMSSYLNTDDGIVCFNVVTSHLNEKLN